MIDLLPGALAVTLVLVIVYMIFVTANKAKVGKEIMFLRPRDKRGERLDVTRETDRSVVCEKSDPVHRFIKIGSSFFFKEGGRSFIRFFGIEGSAYTAMLDENEEEVKISLIDGLRLLWGEKIYNALPDKMKEAVEKDKWGITVEPIKFDAEKHGLEKLSSDDVNDEGDAIVLNRLSKTGTTENLKQKLLGNLIWLGLGFGLAATLANFGLF